MSAETMKLLPLSAVEGKPISVVYDADNGWRAYKAKGAMPGPKFMPTFDLEFGGKPISQGHLKTAATSKRKLLVLDTYGFEGLHMLPEIEDRMVGAEAREAGWQLAIDQDTGRFYRVVYYTEEDGFKGIIAVVCEFLSEYDNEAPKRVVPKKYLKKVLASVRIAKRPWNIKFPHEAWASFFSREIGIPEFLSWAVVSLDFGRNHLLEVHPHGFVRDIKCE